MDIKMIVDNVASKVDTLARSAVKKGGEVAESTKLKLALRTEKNKLEKMFNALGKLFYEQVKGTDVRVQIKTQVMEIDEQKLVIENLAASVAEVSGKAKCASCGKVIDIDATYCSACGNAQAQKKCDEKPTEGTDSSAKAMSADAFVSFFKETTAKYF